MAPRFNKIMSKMRDDEEDTPADVPAMGREDMMEREPDVMPWEKPFPPGVAAQEAFDDMLTRRIVDPLAKAGYEDVGAGFAAIPSAAHSMIVPQTEFDVAGTIIPLPGVAKLMKKGKFRKIRNAMKAEDPENVAGIIAEQAGKEVPASETLDDLYFKLNRMSRDDPEFVIIQDKIDDMTGKMPRPERPKAEVRAIDEKEMLRRADESNAREARRLAEAPIRDGIKKKYGIESENWNALDDEADAEFGTSDLSGKEGDVIEITDGEQTIQVLNDEYLDLMGLSGGIGLDETPFAQKMMKKKPKVDPKDDMFKADQKAKMKRDTEEIESQDPGDRYSNIKNSLSKISQLMEELKKIPGSVEPPKVEPPKKPLSIVEPPKPPKGDPEASSRFPGIQSQLDVAPSRMDERGKAFGDVGQSEFTPYDKPGGPQWEDVPRRNYVESGMDPVEAKVTKMLSDPEVQQLDPRQKQALADFVRARDIRNKKEGLLYQDEFNRKQSGQSDSSKAYDSYMLDKMHGNWRSQEDNAYKALDKAFGGDQRIIGNRNPIVDKVFKDNRWEPVGDYGYEARKIQKNMYNKPKPTQKFIDDYEFEANNVDDAPAKSLQNEMYKGRPSHSEEQAKLFPKVKEAVKEAPRAKLGPGYTQGRYHVKDWAGNDMPQFGTYDDMEEAIDGVYDYFRKQGLDDDALDEVLEDLTVQERKGWKPSKKVTKEESDRLLEEKLKDF